MEDTTAFFNNELVCEDSRLSEAIEKLWKSDLLGSVRPQRGPQPPASNFFRVLVYNFILAEDEALAFPMDKAAIEFQTNRYNKLKLTHNVTKYVERLSEEGLVDLQKGSRESGKRTTLRPTAELQQLVSDLRPLAHLISNQLEPIEVRHERRRLDYDDTEHTKAWRETLQRHADLLGAVEVTFRPNGTDAPVTIPSQSLNYRRLFSRGSWDCGGRLYCDSVQALRRRSVQERQTITFDGATTVEPDYSGQHPRILYLLEGTAAADDVDMYSAWSGIELSKKLAGRSTSDRRDLAKFLMLAALNAKTADDACGAAKKALDNKPPVPKRDARALYKAMKQHHAAVAHHFSSDIGIRLQRLDSDIMLLVMAEMTTRRLACLSVHDSLICRQDDEAVAVGLMHTASLFYLGHPLPVDSLTNPKVERLGLCSDFYAVESKAAREQDIPLGLHRLRQPAAPVSVSEREEQRRSRASKQRKLRKEKERLEWEDAEIL